MSEAATTPVGANPFTGRTALALVLFGCLVFVALLWMIGNGLADGEANNGGAHAEGRGLNGYAALARLLEARGHPVRRSRTDRGFEQPGLLILTPPADANGEDIAEAVDRHRPFGPTLVITPKWASVPAAGGDLPVRKGWVQLVGPSPPNWPGFLDELTVNLARGKRGETVGWYARGISGAFPDPRVTMFGAGPGLVPLVTGSDGRIYVAYRDDGEFPSLAGLASRPRDRATHDRSARYPLIVVFDPDLLDNYGMASLPSARLAATLVQASAGADAPVIFDLTLNGLERKANLLTLAFTPPFLAATLCLLLAAAATGWRAFLRFGPPLAPARSIAFGKRALVSNAAALIVRSRRLHLLGAPYAEAARQRLARAFALPRTGDLATETAALDRAARAAGSGDHAFSNLAARLGRARSERELVKAAAELHALERTLTK
ncbi:hypothetical protein HNO88_000919 [Novosphingobium chloroacetimidivorans]|uniref:DUF4350 domain-containing protein n=1 Tax=Novosphingobium chloroacetimidivorans TaxID=1428314 RepID=A0A7W7K8Q9_9SPHN|nr:DUF4350 domain-containing protein [Novosphingobium chloroacetimidivorans]MBB4857608.1 hypothetical protein [Novosphingobium chloroacetimidivorans]